MNMFKKFKNSVLVAATMFVLGAVAFSGISVDAATITKKPTVNSKQTVAIGDTTYVNTVSNFKINGKSYKKYKKKIKVVQTYNDPSYWTNEGTKTNYIDNEFISDTEKYKQSQENDKYISAQSYDIKFLKAGTYTISYDTYSEGGSKTVDNADNVSSTTTSELIKTTYKFTYKVVPTTDPLKVFALGKTKYTYTTKNSGNKVNTKTVIKNKFLRGNSGKLSMKASSKNYAVTSAFVVSYDAQGKVVVTASGNGKKVNYGKYKKQGQSVYAKTKVDANGNVIYKKDAAGKDTYDVDYDVVTTGKYASKYKPTTVYYGYRDKFTGASVTFSVYNKTVYVREKDDKNQAYYVKDAEGKPVKDADGRLQYATKAVTATVIKKVYKERGKLDSAYNTYDVVSECVVLPGQDDLYESETYYLDEKSAKRAENRMYSGNWAVVSKAGIAKYQYITMANGCIEKYDNPVYYRRLYNAKYAGSWQPVDINDNYSHDSSASDFTIDPATGNKTVTAKYRWVESTDNQGKKTEIVDLHKVSLSSRCYNVYDLYKK